MGQGRGSGVTVMQHCECVLCPTAWERGWAKLQCGQCERDESCSTGYIHIAVNEIDYWREYSHGE